MRTPEEINAAFQAKIDTYPPVGSQKPTDADCELLDKTITRVVFQIRGYDQIDNKHHLQGAIWDTARYNKKYGYNYLIPPLIPVYDKDLADDATGVVCRRVETENTAKRLNRSLYECVVENVKKLVFAVIDEMWYQQLEDYESGYEEVTALELLAHIRKNSVGLHATDAIKIQVKMLQLYPDSTSVTDYINMLEKAQCLSIRSKLQPPNCRCQSSRHCDPRND